MYFAHQTATRIGRIAGVWIRITNHDASSKRVGIEPWGDYVTLACGEGIGVSWHAPRGAYIDLHIDPDEIKLWAEGDPNAQLELDRDGRMDNEIARDD